MKKRYIIFICAFFMAICIFLFMFFYDKAKQESIDNLNTTQMLHARQAAQGIEDFFANWTKELSILSEVEYVKSMDRTGINYVENVYRRNTEFIRAITRVDARGRVMYTIPYDHNAIGKDLSSQKHVGEIMKTHKPVISDVFSTVQGFSSIALHVPVLTNGTYQGTMGIAINFQALAKRYLEAIKIGKTGYAWVISRDGTELYCPVPGHVGNSVFENCKDYPSILAMANNMLKKREGTTVYAFDKIGGQSVNVVKKHAVYMPIYIGNTFWSIVVASSEDEVLSSLTGFRNRLLIVIGILLLSGIFFSYYGLKAWFVIQEQKKRRNIEKALRESEEKFRLLFEESSDPTLLIDWGKIIDCNEAAVRLLQCSNKNEVIGLTTSRLSPEKQPDGRLSSEKAREMKKMAEERGANRFEWVHRTIKGEDLFVEISLTVISINGRQILHTVWRDIRERKRAENALKQAEEKYRDIFEDAVMGIFRTTLEGRILDANAALAAICGYGSPLELIDTCADIGAELYVNQKDRVEFKRLLQKHKSVEHFETQFYRKDRSKIWISMNAHSVTNQEGDIVFYEGTIEDISVRKQAEEELRATHQRLSDIIEFLPDATFVIDDKKKVVAWNRACEEMTGVGKEEIIGKGDYIYAVPFYGERRPILIDLVTMGSNELRRKYTSIRRKGHFLYAESYTPTLHNGKGAYLTGDASPLFDKEGNIVGAIESIRDVTEIKYLETQLLHSQKMEAIGTLAGGIAHDFNNILTASTGYASLLQMEVGMSDRQRSYVDQILVASQKAADLTQSLLTFSRQKTATLVPLNINSTIAITEKLLKRLLTEDIELRTHLKQDNIIVKANQTQIDQILFNLATNARDAMPKGGTLTIETDTVSIDNAFIETHGFGEPGRYLLISVSDTGIGMDNETCEKIFDPFFTTKEVGKGTGLGLATVYGVVKQHNGYITVESELNRGTSFRIFLPAVETESDEEQGTATTIIKGNETILIAEDDEAVRDFMRQVLQTCGYKTVEAMDGEDTIHKFKQHMDIDLILLDSVMPKKNGYEAYREICGIKPHIKVLFTSGYTKDVILDKGIEDGEFDFIAKPVKVAELLGKIRQILDRQEVS